MKLSHKCYEHFKGILHPNLKANADHYYENGFYVFPIYYGCGRRNRNCTNKGIDYKRGEQCLFPTHKHWIPFKELTKKDLRQKIYYMRYMSNLGISYLAKTKQSLWYDWDEKKYKPKSDWYNVKDPGKCPV